MLITTPTLAILAACVSSALSLPQIGVAEVAVAALPTPAKTQNVEGCDLRLWVRADDLAPSTIVEGDVRLLNNMTHLSPAAAEGCRILHWSLQLRSRERAAIQIPLADVTLPKRPSYNYTWDENNDYSFNRRYRANDMLLEGQDALSLFVNRTDPYQAEKAAYDQSLEEYVRTVQNADNWIVREEESTLFDAIQAADPATLETTDGLQISTFSFGVAVPHVRLAEEDQSRIMWWSSEGEGEEGKIKYHDERDLSYFAEVVLANGSTVEVKGGRTKFFAPGRNEEMVDLQWLNFTLQEQDPSCYQHGLLARWGQGHINCTLYGANAKQTGGENESSVLFGTFQSPVVVRRGEKMTIKGSLSSLSGGGALEKYESIEISFDIQRRRDRNWALKQIEMAGADTNRTKADLEPDYVSASSYYISGDNLGMHSSAVHVEKELKREIERLERRGRSKKGKSSRRAKLHYIDDMDDASAFLTDANSFELNMTIPADLSGLQNTLFRQEALDWVITVNAKERKRRLLPTELRREHSQNVTNIHLNRGAGKSVHELSHNETRHWTEYGADIYDLDLSAEVGEDEEEGVVMRRFVGRVPVERFVNPKVQLRKRSELLGELTSRGRTEASQEREDPPYYLDEGARAPIFVDVSSDEKLREAAALVDPNSAQWEKSPLINKATKVLSHHPKISSSRTHASHGMQSTSHQDRLKYRKTRYHTIDRRDYRGCQDVNGACGGAESDVGKVWANNVILPKFKAALRREAKKSTEEAQGQDKSPSFVVQS